MSIVPREGPYSQGAGAVRAWLHVVGVRHPDPPAGAAQALAEAGLEIRRRERDAASGLGVLFFDEISDELCRFVREISRDGEERILAVAAASPALDGGAWRLLAAGASDALAWDHSVQPAAEVAARLRRWELVDRLVRSPLVRDQLVGESRAWRAVLREVVEVASCTDVSVLVTGESGTGKELVARLIHTLDPRPAKRDLVILDCTTVVPSLSGSEFFGHERGAFTGAVAAREGAFAMADGGTLFLDEVGELPLGLQAELLRVVQEGTYKRVGGNAWRRASFRLVCATNRDLAQEQSRGTFRRDFYHRIAAWRCELPSLRERPEDILPLTRHFLRQLAAGREPPELDRPVQELLLHRDYLGNVRDLRHLVTSMARRHVGTGPITVGDVPVEERPAGPAGAAKWSEGPFEQSIRRALAHGATLQQIGQTARETAIRVALASTDGNLQQASRLLGVTDRALQLRRAARLETSEGRAAVTAAAGSPAGT